MERFHRGAAAAGDDGPGAAAVEASAIDAHVAGGRREIGHLAAAAVGVGQERRLHREPHHLAPEHRERRQAVDRRVVAAPHGELELVAELVQRAAIDRPDRRLEAVVAVLLLIDRGHSPVAVGIGEPAVDLPADGVDDAALDPGELAKRGEAPGEREVAHHHLVAGVLSAGPELRQSLAPPEREVEPAVPRSLEIGLAEQVELEDVHHLVPEGVAELGEVPPERHRDPALQEVRRPEQPFGRGEGKDVGLLEVGVRGIDHQRDPLGDIVAELHRQRVEARLGVSQGGGRQVGFGGVVVQIDVRAAHDPPVELPVLDLVLAEGEKLRLEPGWERRAKGGDSRHQDEPPAYDRHVRLTSTGSSG